METNPYNDKRYSNVESSTAGQQFVTPVQTREQMRGPQQKAAQQKPKAALRMPKAQAQALSRNLKKAVAVTSVLGFGAFSGLLAYQQVHAAATTTTTTTTTTTNSTQSNSDSGSFFKQGGETNVGSSSTAKSSAGTSSSSSQSANSGASSSSATPVTGTSVSQVHNP